MRRALQVANSRQTIVARPQRRHNFWFSAQSPALEKAQAEGNFKSDFWVSTTAPQAMNNIRLDDVHEKADTAPQTTTTTTADLETPVEYYNLQDLLDARTGAPLLPKSKAGDPRVSAAFPKVDQHTDVMTKDTMPETVQNEIDQILKLRGLKGSVLNWWLRKDEFATRQVVVRRGALSVMTKITRAEVVVNSDQLVDPSKVLDIAISGGTKKIFSEDHAIQEHRRQRQYESNIFFSATQAHLLGLSIKGQKKPVVVQPPIASPDTATKSGDDAKDTAVPKPETEAKTKPDPDVVPPPPPCRINEPDYWVYNLGEFHGWRDVLARLKLTEDPEHPQLLHNRQQIEGQAAVASINAIAQARQEADVEAQVKQEGSVVRPPWEYPTNFWVTSELVDEMSLKLVHEVPDEEKDIDSSRKEDKKGPKRHEVARVKIGSNAHHSPTTRVELFNLSELEDPAQAKKVFGSLVR